MVAIRGLRWLQRDVITDVTVSSTQSVTRCASLSSCCLLFFAPHCALIILIFIATLLDGYGVFRELRKPPLIRNMCSVFLALLSKKTLAVDTKLSAGFDEIVFDGRVVRRIDSIVMFQKE